MSNAVPQPEPHPGVLDIFLASLVLGATAFGGPVAHIGFYRTEFVERRRWIDPTRFADLVALCQLLPGPASSQTLMAIGMMHRGLAGGIAALLGFTLPAATIMIALAYGVGFAETPAGQGIVHGLKLAAVAVVANALWGMARNACTDRATILFAAGACVAVLTIPIPWIQIVVIAVAALAGAAFLRGEATETDGTRASARTGAATAVYAALFAVLLFGLPFVADAVPTGELSVFSSLYRVGALVFGGGHVVLPLLEGEVVPTGWTSPDIFLAGYGAAQAIPGPLFAIGGYLGAVVAPAPGYVGGWIGGLIGTVAIFLPSILILGAALPHWEALRGQPRIRGALTAVNAAVVGLLLAVLYTPVWTSSVADAWDFAAVVVAIALLAGLRAPPWLVVLLAALAGFLGI